MPKTNEENFEIIFSKLCEKKINIILPTRDGELEFWSSNYNRFNEKGINLVNLKIGDRARSGLRLSLRISLVLTG